MNGVGQRCEHVKHYTKRRHVMTTPAAKYDGTNGKYIASWARYHSYPKVEIGGIAEPVRVLLDGRLAIDTQHGSVIAEVGSYVVMDPKGHFYPCEAEIFEESYQEGEIRDLGWALDMLRAGGTVRRRGWNGKGMYLWLHTGIIFDNEGTASKPFIVMHNARGEEQPGWLASQEDLLATDWERRE